MDARTAARIRQGHALKLRVVQHQYAAPITSWRSRAVERHARKLARLHSKIKAEAISIAGADNADHHMVGFDEHSSIATQQANNEGGYSVEGAGLVDVVEMANTMANRADRVAACSVPPVLFSE